MTGLEKTKNFLGDVLLGIKSFPHFRIQRFPKLLKALGPLEKKILVVALTTLLVMGSYLVAQSYYGSTVASPDYGGKYTEGLVGQPRFINPVLASANNVDMDISRIVYSGLLSYDENQVLAPDLATEMPTLSEDGKQYIVKLRQDVTWHDGQPFTADDVVFTIKLIQDANYASPLRLVWNKVEVTAIDDYTVTFSLKEPSAPFIANLTQGILPKHSWEGVEASKFHLASANLEPVGTGPFMLHDLKKSQEGEIRSLTLTAFEDYHRGRPYLDSIEFKFYETYDQLITGYHSTDILGLGYIPFDKKLYVEKSSRINQYALNLPQYQAVFFNIGKSPVLADKNVRAALIQSMNRQEVIDEVYYGLARPAYGPIPPGYLGYNAGVEQAHLYNVDNARKLLADTGFEPVEGQAVLKKGEVPLSFTLTTNNFPLNVRAAEVLKRQWEAVGFQVNLNILTVGELEQQYMRPRQYEALLFSENIGADPDPFAFWHSSQRSDPGLNLSLFNNKEADNLMTEARSNSDPEYRRIRYERLQEIITDEIPAAFIVNSVYIYGVNSRIQGIELKNVVTASERFSNIDKWYISTKRSLKKD